MKRNKGHSTGKRPSAGPPAPPPPVRLRSSKSSIEAHHVLVFLLSMALLAILGGTVSMIWHQWQTAPPTIAEAPPPAPKPAPKPATVPAAKPQPKPAPSPPVSALPTLAEDTVDRALVESAVPPTYVQRLWVETRSDAQGKWQYLGYDVTLPPDLTWPKLRSKLVSSLAGNRLSVIEERSADPGTARIRVAQQSRIIAEAVIHPMAPPPDMAVSTLKGSEPPVEEELVIKTDTKDSKTIQANTNSNTQMPSMVAQAHQETGTPEAPEPQSAPVPVPPPTPEPAPALPPAAAPEQEPEPSSLPVTEALSVPEPAPTPKPIPEANPEIGVPSVPEPAPAPMPESAPAVAPPSPAPPPEPAAPPKPEPTEKVLIASEKDGRPRVAVILDDGGYGGPDTEQALSLDPKVTLAILPNTPAARHTAQRAAEKGFEVMLHMPMETAVKGIRAVTGQLDTGMDRDAIHRLTLEALAQVPGAKGVNYHTGGKFIQDYDRTRWFMEVVRDQQLYFVDSRTTGHSAGHAAAAALGVRNADRDVFLDNESAPGYIRRQFELLVNDAQKRGAAIGIGHFRRSTIVVLRELLPKLPARGIELVHVSELLP